MHEAFVVVDCYRKQERILTLQRARLLTLEPRFADHVENLEKKNTYPYKKWTPKIPNDGDLALWSIILLLRKIA